MTEWKSMDTAPKDGSIIDLWTGSERIADCYFERGEWRHWWIGGFDQMDSVKIEGEPSHWTPLPSSPQGSGERGIVFRNIELAVECLRRIIANANNKNWRKPELVEEAARALVHLDGAQTHGSYHARNKGCHCCG